MKRPAMVLVGIALAALAACDKLYADPVVGGPPPSPEAGTITTPTRPPVPCPHDEVTENSPCVDDELVCEYGKSPDPQCNTTWTCAGGEYWTVRTEPQCPFTCPSDAEIVDGAPCDLSTFGDAGATPAADAELQCTTTHGTCACTTGPDGAHAHPPRWVCVLPAPGCPAERPLLAQACLGDHSCDYGACAFKRGARLVCRDEVWQIEQAQCP